MTPAELKKYLDNLVAKAVEREMGFVLGRLDNILGLCARQYPDGEAAISQARSLLSLYQGVYRPEAITMPMLRPAKRPAKPSTTRADAQKRRWAKYHEEMAERDEGILRMINSGKTYREVSVATGLSVMTIGNILHRRRGKENNADYSRTG